MRIESKEKGSKNFYRECVNVLVQYRSLLKKPDAKLKDYFRLMRNYLILLGVFLVVIVVMNVMWGFDSLGFVAIAVLAVVMLLTGVYLRNMNKILRDMQANYCPSVLTLDEKGVFLARENGENVSMLWENIAFIRGFRESVGFLVGNATGISLFSNIEHKETIYAYVREHGIDVTVIDQ